LMINDINKYLGNGIEIGTALREEKDNYIYYKTDHHWTSYGAYLAYKEYCKANKLKAMSLEEFEEININDFYGTFYSKSKLFNSQADILTYYEMKNLKMKIGNGEYEYIYNLDNLKKRDKYSVFLDGNHSQIIIKNDEATNNKKLLVLKDSFANSFIPFVANHFDEVHVIDLRHFYGSLKEYIKLNNFDEILNVYSLKTLAEDNTIARINF
ncbi:MAG: DHHW family protein, partial [Sarcina sp.]